MSLNGLKGLEEIPDLLVVEVYKPEIRLVPPPLPEDIKYFWHGGSPCVCGLPDNLQRAYAAQHGMAIEVLKCYNPRQLLDHYPNWMNIRACFEKLPFNQYTALIRRLRQVSPDFSLSASPPIDV